MGSPGLQAREEGAGVQEAVVWHAGLRVSAQASRVRREGRARADKGREGDWFNIPVIVVLDDRRL